MLPSDFPDQAFSVQPSTRALARGSASGSPRRQGTRGLGSRVIVAMTALVLAGGAVSPTAFAKGSGFSSSSSRSSYSSGSSRSSYSSSYSSSSSSSRSSYSSPSYGSSSYSSSSNRSSSSSPSYGGSSYNSTSSKSTYSSPSYSSPSNSGSSSSSTSERSSYTAPNYSGSSYSASSQPSTPSQATPPKTSGFTSSGTSKVIAATALGGALYAAQSGHDAAATLSANQAAHGSANVTTPSSISNGSTVSQGATKSAPPARRTSLRAIARHRRKPWWSTTPAGTTDSCSATCSVVQAPDMIRSSSNNRLRRLRSQALRHPRLRAVTTLRMRIHWLSPRTILLKRPRPKPRRSP